MTTEAGVSGRAGAPPLRTALGLKAMMFDMALASVRIPVSTRTTHFGECDDRGLTAGYLAAVAYADAATPDRSNAIYRW